MAIAARHGLPVVEDNAHGLFGRYKGRPLGSFGALATLSFHETKNFTCGEGGALLINDARYIERAEIIREKGTNRSRFFRGEVDKYTWVDVGSSYLPSDMLAAYLLGAARSRATRSSGGATRSGRGYARELAAGRGRAACACPIVPGGLRAPGAPVLPADAVARGAHGAHRHMRARQILAVFHYQPLHLSEWAAASAASAGSAR